MPVHITSPSSMTAMAAGRKVCACAVRAAAGGAGIAVAGTGSAAAEPASTSPAPNGSRLGGDRGRTEGLYPHMVRFGEDELAPRLGRLLWAAVNTAL